MTVKNVAKHLVPVNRKIGITLDQEKILWFGRLSIKTFPPEYFLETESANNDYFLPSLEITPISWADAFANSPRWLIQSLSYEERSTDADLSATAEHRIIYMSHVHYHLVSTNITFIDMFLLKCDVNELRKSVDTLELIVKEFDGGMLIANMATLGPAEFVQKSLDQAHSALAEIHEKLN